LKIKKIGIKNFFKAADFIALELTPKMKLGKYLTKMNLIKQGIWLMLSMINCMISEMTSLLWKKSKRNSLPL
jgi:hypothetical protein